MSLWVLSIVTEGCWDVVEWDDWNVISVFLRLIVRQNCLAAEAKQSLSLGMSSSMWALMAQSSANSSSRRMVSITIGHRSETIIRSNTPPSIRGRRYNLGTEYPSRHRGSLQQIVRRVAAKCAALFITPFVTLNTSEKVENPGLHMKLFGNGYEFVGAANFYHRLLPSP